MAEIALLIDTDVLVDFFRGSPEAGQWLVDHKSETIGVPVIVLMELLQGARSPAEQRAIREPLERFWIEHLESGDSQQALDWFSAYRLSHGTGIMDCLIATAAARLKVPLYTFNVRHSIRSTCDTMCRYRPSMCASRMSACSSPIRRTHATASEP